MGRKQAASQGALLSKRLQQEASEGALGFPEGASPGSDVARRPQERGQEHRVPRGLSHRAAVAAPPGLQGQGSGGIRGEGKKAGEQLSLTLSRGSVWLIRAGVRGSS